MLDNKTIGERIKKARDAKDLSLAEFGGPIQIDTSRLSKIERGLEGIALPQMAALAEHHGLNLIYLVTGDGEILQSSERETESQTLTQSRYFTADQIFHIFMKSVERQDKLMEGQTAILKSIESKMARADAQTSTEGKIDEVLSNLADSKKVDLLAAKHLDLQFQKISNLLLQAGSHRKGASADADNKLDGNGEGAQTPRRRRKGGK